VQFASLNQILDLILCYYLSWLKEFCHQVFPVIFLVILLKHLVNIFEKSEVVNIPSIIQFNSLIK